MKGAQIVVETLAYSPLSCLTWLTAGEHFIQFSRRESFKLYSIKFLPHENSKFLDNKRHNLQIGTHIL
jgi:hypothetical protein